MYWFSFLVIIPLIVVTFTAYLAFLIFGFRQFKNEEHFHFIFKFIITLFLIVVATSLCIFIPYLVPSYLGEKAYGALVSFFITITILTTFVINLLIIIFSIKKATTRTTKP